ncbi:MAG: hypothetical protein WC485_12680 [Opitutaceae bacterium]
MKKAVSGQWSAVGVAALGLLCASCAFQNPLNRPLMNYCTRQLVPDSTTGKILAAPLYGPACLAAGVADTVVVHPILAAGDAWRDTEVMLWRPTGRGYVTECAILPVRAVLTVPIGAVIFASRAVFDIPAWPPSPERLEEQLLNENPAMRRAAIEALRSTAYSGADAAPAAKAMVKACRAWPDDVEFCEAVIQRLPDPLTESSRAYLAGLAKTGAGRLCLDAIFRLFLDALYQPGPKPDAAQIAHMEQAADCLAQLYDDLAAAGHKEAELSVAFFAGNFADRPGPQAVGLYIERSLAQRGWPVYAENVSFLLQTRLLGYADAARIDGARDNWRALRVDRAIWQYAVKQAQGRLKAGQPSRLEEFARAETQLLAELEKARTGRAAERAGLLHSLDQLRTQRDAEELAARVMAGSEADQKLFFEHPVGLLQKKGSP